MSLSSCLLTKCLVALSSFTWFSKLNPLISTFVGRNGSVGGRRWGRWCYTFLMVSQHVACVLLRMVLRVIYYRWLWMNIAFIITTLPIWGRSSLSFPTWHIEPSVKFLNSVTIHPLTQQILSDTFYGTVLFLTQDTQYINKTDQSSWSVHFGG